MPVHIITVRFNPEKEVFEDDNLNRFLVNKHVKTMKSEFFQTNSGTFWSVFVEYEPILGQESQDEDSSSLNEPQKLLFHKLKQWRAEKAQKEGVPVFIIATNKELSQVVKKSPTTVEALRQISGFGKKKVERHGRDLIEIVTAFFEKDGEKDEK